MSSTSSGLPGSSSSNSGLPKKRIRLRPRDVLFLVLVAGGFAYFSAPQLFAPWVYFTGGSFHAMPWWSGAGSFTAPDGEYQIYLFLKPMNERAHRARTTLLQGEGHLCTPEGERLILHISGDMDRHLSRDTVGQGIEISSFTRSKPGTFSAMTPPGSPYVYLNGIWGVGKIEATGMLKYQPAAPGEAAPPKAAPIAVTLEQASDWWPPACKAR